MFIYTVCTHICESYITGDVRIPLLRTVPLDVDHIFMVRLNIKVS